MALKKCPFVEHMTFDVNKGNYWKCNENSCRFQLDGDCLLLRPSRQVEENAALLEEIATTLLERQH